jgi:hypothetical protein
LYQPMMDPSTKHCTTSGRVSTVSRSAWIVVE